MSIRIVETKAMSEPVAELERIHLKVQESFHDQWDWFSHSFAIEQIKAFDEYQRSEIAAKAATIAAQAALIEELRTGLKQFGRHARGCHSYDPTAYCPYCNCGFQSVIDPYNAHKQSTAFKPNKSE